jgi:predicted permease
VAVSSPALLLLGFGTGAAFGTKVGERIPRPAGRLLHTESRRSSPAVAGLLVPDSFAPDVLVDISRGFVIALLPIGFFAVGRCSQRRPRSNPFLSRSARPFHPPIGAAILLRLVIAPGLLLLLSLPFIDLPGPYLLLAAMPCGINTLLVAHVYGLDSKLAAQAVAWTTAIAVVAVLIAQSIWG